MKKILSFLMFFLVVFPSYVSAGYIFHHEIDTGGKKNKIVYRIEGKNKRIDVFMSGEMNTSVISNPKRKTSLYLMHDSETYMTSMPGTPEIPTSFPAMKYEQPKQPINPAQKVVDGMDREREVRQRIKDFKYNPKDAAYDSMMDLSYGIEEYQQKQMMKKQMAQVEKMQKQMMKNMEGQMKLMKRRMEKNKRLKNSIAIKDFKVKTTNKTKKIGKYKAKLVQVYYKGAHFQDCWVTNDLGKETTKAINSFTADLKLNDSELSGYFKTMKALNDKVYAHGFPVSTVSHYNEKTRILYGHVYDTAAPKKVEVKLTKFEKKKIKSSEFVPPKGYEEFSKGSM